MSAKLKSNITLFVLIAALNPLLIECSLSQQFNGCFLLCLTRFPANRVQRRACTADCKQEDRSNSNQSSTESHQNDLEQKEDSTETSPEIPQGSIQPRSRSRPRSRSSESTTIKNYGSLDYINLGEFKIVQDNHHDYQSEPTFPTVPQPDHCGFKSIKDMNKAKILGGSGLGRVVGGLDAEPHEFPWVVSIQYFKTKADNESVHFCGGAIITKNYIITAAHCMDRFIDKQKTLVIKIGVNSLKQKSAQHIVASQVIVHEGWDSSRQLNDISLIRVSPDIKFTKTETGKFEVNALCLPNDPSEPNGNGVLAGWGEEAYKTGVAAEWLQKVTVPFVERDQCHNVYKAYLARVSPNSKVKVLRSHVCAGGKGGEDACRGDSGGAIMQSKGRQSFHIGIVSFSVPCAIKDLPTIYSSVVHFIDWIYKNVVDH